MVKCCRWDFELHVSECAARDNKIMLKTGVMNDEDLLEGEDKSSKFKARIHDFYMKVRCAGCGTFGAHASRKCNGTWIVKLVVGHFAGCKGGNNTGSRVLAQHKAGITSGMIATRPPRGSNPHHRSLSFEAGHFVRIVAEVLHDDLDLKKRGHSTASVKALMGIFSKFVHQPITIEFAKRARTITLDKMYGNASTDITLMPSIERELTECGYIVEVQYKHKPDMIAISLGAQEVRIRVKSFSVYLVDLTYCINACDISVGTVQRNAQAPWALGPGRHTLGASLECPSRWRFVFVFS